MKALKITGIILAIFIALMLLIPIVFKSKIVEAVKQQANKNLAATVDFKDFDVTLITTFPNLGFELYKTTIIGINEFKNDTLLSADAFAVRLSVWDLISTNNLTIKSISLSDANLNVHITENGKANYDIVKTDSTTTPTDNNQTAFKLALKKYSINNTNINYADEQGKMYAKIQKLNHSGSGDFTQDVVSLATQTAIENLTFINGHTAYINHVNVKSDIDFSIDMKEDKYSFTKAKIALNELILNFDGVVALADSAIFTDLTWRVEKNDFKNFLSLIPAIYTHSFNDLTCSGTLAAHGDIKGSYNNNNIPAFNVMFQIQDGHFKYKQLPQEVSKVNILFEANNATGLPDATIINLKKLQAVLGTDAISARLKLTTPISNPYLDAALSGKLNLDNIKNFIPLEKDETLSGQIEADINAKGYYANIEQSAYDKFNADGMFSLSNMRYQNKSLAHATVIKHLKLLFNPEKVTLENADVKYGNSDFKAKGTLQNFWGYYLSNQLLTGNLSLQSDQINLTDFTSYTSSDTTSKSGTTSVIAVPANIEFNLNASGTKIIYDNLLVENFAGVLQIKNQAIELQNVMFNALGGGVKMSGMYATNNNTPKINYDLEVTKIDIVSAYTTFDAIKKMAPAVSYVKGKVSSKFKLIGLLNAQMKPQLNSLTGQGNLSTHQLGISNMPVLGAVAQALQMPALSQPVVNDVNLAFSFVDGRVTVNPYQMVLNQNKATISGSNGFDQTIDYVIKLEIPKSKIPASAMGTVNGLLQKANAQLNTQLTLPDPLKIDVTITGNLLKPQVKTQLLQTGKGVAQTITDAVVDKGKAEARLQADKLLAEAELKASQLKAAAKQAADLARKQGYAQADALIKNAGNNPLAVLGAQKAADKLKKETDKKALQIETEASQKADLILLEARNKADAVLK